MVSRPGSAVAGDTDTGTSTGTGTGVGLSVREIAGWSGPRSGLAAALDGVDGALLTGRWAGGGALVMADPIDTVVDAPDPFAVLDELAALPAPPAHRHAVGGGWFGYLGFEAGAEPNLTVQRQHQQRAGAAVATTYWALHPNLIRYERATGRWFDEALVGLLADDELEQRRQNLVACVQAAGAVATIRSDPGPLRSATSQAEHLRAVRAGQEHIAAGDIYQVNLCLALAGKYRDEPGAAFDVLAAELEPGYGAFLRGAFAADGGPAAIVSASPELYLHRRGREVVSAPIKGTRPRPPAASAAAAEARRLQSSNKDRAENIMITDLVRNDLSRVAVVGSVQVTALLRLEPHPGVWHLVSEVHAQLPPTTSHADLLRATFPPGSVTGAPKIRALEIIAELESRRRGVYTGAIGYVSPVAGLELSVAIRTVVLADGEAVLGVGGGITADSDPKEEWWECFDKASAVAAAVGSSIDVVGARRPPSFREVAADAVMRP